ncbi:MAG TPA: hypothetical protein VF538_12565 [Pyrinomonadaceae bacterium]|jgi:hypothetical protein
MPSDTQTRLSHLAPRGSRRRELGVFALFLALAVVMTWPLAAHLSDHVSDPGDPYLISWTLWWDYHQTFHDPLRLFHANIFYPYQYSLAFSENLYGIALPLFPLFALGLRPLAVQAVAVLLAFAFSGYGMFRLTRTLTGSTGAAWVAGVAYAFVPFRFDHLPHLMYMFGGWVPLLLEALVLFARARTRRRAVWLGAAFLLNALSCVHWFVLSLLPLALAAAVLATRHRLWRERAFWLRAAVCLGAASLLLLPFMLPYARVARLYGFTRGSDEMAHFSVLPVNWLVASHHNKLWGPLTQELVADPGERALFPGLLLLLLPLAALLLPARARRAADGDAEPPGAVVVAREPPKWLLLTLDAAALLLSLTALYAGLSGGFRLRLGGATLVAATKPSRALFYLTLVVLARLCLAYPRALRPRGESSLRGTLRSARRDETLLLGGLWAALGFFGSFGANFFFHRTLYEMVPLYRSIRVPARWAAIAYVGLALLAAVGARRLAALLSRRAARARRREALVYAVLVAALLVELRAAPLALYRGAAEPDAVTLRLKETPMRGGVVALPAGDGLINYYYTLRAADHARPLVNAVSGFTPPIEAELETLTRARTVPARLLDLLEEIPASYVVVYNGFLVPERRRALEPFLRWGVSTGRLRFIRSFGDGGERQDLYAVTRTEPGARAEAEGPPPSDPAPVSPEEALLGPPADDAAYYVRQQHLAVLGREPSPAELAALVARLDRCAGEESCAVEARARLTLDLLRSEEFRDGAFFVFRLYRAALDRPPGYPEFWEAHMRLAQSSGPDAKLSFTKLWLEGGDPRRRYPPELSPAEFAARVPGGDAAAGGRASRAAGVGGGAGARAEFFAAEAERLRDDAAEYERAFVTMQYFALLRREPESGARDQWRARLASGSERDYLKLVEGFLGSGEYRARFEAR